MPDDTPREMNDSVKTLFGNIPVVKAKVPLSASVDQDVIEALNDIQETYDQNRSQVVNRILREFLGLDQVKKEGHDRAR